MKNEGIIMVGEGKEVMNNPDVEKKDVNTRQNEQANKPEKIGAKSTIPHNSQEPESSKKAQITEDKPGGKEKHVDNVSKDVRSGTGTVDEPEKREDQVGEVRFIDLKPETEDRLSKFSVEVETDGNKVTKTALDAVKEMNVLSKKELPAEQKNKEYLESVMLLDKLTQKYRAGSADGEELRNILFNEAFGRGDIKKGQELQKWFQDQVNVIATGEGKVQVNVNGLAKIMAVKLDESKIDELGKLIKQLPLPEGVGAAPMVTAGEDGQITITPAPHGEEAGQVVPAPGEGGGISKTTETPGIPGGKSQGNGDGGNNTTTEEEKKKFDWYKYGNNFLLLLILYIGLQGWTARMWEQFAERAR